MIYGNWELQDLVLSDTIHQGYLFQGISGIGKATLAKEKAKLILGVDPASSPDFVTLSGKEGVIRKEDILEVLPILEHTPQGRYRVVLIDNANRATVEAQNSLLKVVENPPAPTVFFFIAHSDEKGRILNTISSRCVPMSFRPVSGEILDRMLKKESSDEQDIEIAIACCGGSYTVARECLKDSELQDLFRMLLSERGPRRLTKLNLLKEKADLPALLSPLLRGYLQALCDYQLPAAARLLKSIELGDLGSETARIGALKNALTKARVNELTREDLLILFS